MTTDFGYLKQLDVTKEKTAEFSMPQIMVNGKSPVLVVTPATEANAGYFNALLKRSKKAARLVRSGNISVQTIKDNRGEDRTLYPKYVVKGWRDVVDATGEEVPFSAEACADFLAALPDWLFDDLNSFCKEPTNFSEALDIETAAKN